jgi:hypothetical protein
MHNILSGSATFPYLALEGRQAQESLAGCVELRNKILKALNIVCVVYPGMRWYSLMIL